MVKLELCLKLECVSKKRRTPILPYFAEILRQRPNENGVSVHRNDSFSERRDGGGLDLSRMSVDSPLDSPRSGIQNLQGVVRFDRNDSMSFRRKGDKLDVLGKRAPLQRSHQFARLGIPNLDDIVLERNESFCAQRIGKGHIIAPDQRAHQFTRLGIPNTDVVVVDGNDSLSEGCKGDELDFAGVPPEFKGGFAFRGMKLGDEEERNTDDKVSDFSHGNSPWVRGLGLG